jgi:hypothetical protein
VNVPETEQTVIRKQIKFLLLYKKQSTFAKNNLKDKKGKERKFIARA